MLRKLIIFIMCCHKHDYKKPFEVRHGTRLIECKRCGQKYAMHDGTRAFIRYDNDPEFKKDLKRVYPELNGFDL